MDLTLICLVGTGENFHQRGFAGAIVPDNPHDLTLSQLQVNTLKSLDAPKTFTYSLHLNSIFHNL